jgi:hypothetical protein
MKGRKETFRKNKRDKKREKYRNKEIKEEYNLA